MIAPLHKVSRAGMLATGWAVVRVTVSSLTTVTAVIGDRRDPRPALLVRARSRENFTSAAVMGCPLEKVTPWRSATVQERWSALGVTDRAKPGRSDFPFVVA